MGSRANDKKARRQLHLKPGDLVTWGLGLAACEVVEVASDGVYVDSVLTDGTPAHRSFVTWSGGKRGRGPGSTPLSRVKR